MKKQLWLIVLLGSVVAKAQINEPTINDIENLAGCYLVDYNYSENKVIDPNYKLDPRVYDSTRFIVKELVKVVDRTDESVRIQHFMQADDYSGETIFMMRHHGEIWRKNPQYRYRYIGRFKGNDRWEVQDLDENPSQWVREITSLDDGPRYQCLGKWRQSHSFPRFDCKAYSPIPGRETRDMGRTDYNTLSRKSSVLLYSDSWLERQNNTKIQFSSAGKNPLVEEVGKIWSVRLPDSKCSNIDKWANKRQPFWDILANSWKQAYDQKRDFYEVKIVGGSTRGRKISKIMQEHFENIENDPDLALEVQAKILRIIEQHRE